MSAENILSQLFAAMNELLTEPVGSRRVKITDLTPRDGQQCKLATRVKTDDLLPLCAALDNCGFHAVEVWGGATAMSVALLKEDWDSCGDQGSDAQTKLQMLRAGNIFWRTGYTDKSVATSRAHMANGMNVFVFEATNDFRNTKLPPKSERPRRRGAVEGTIP